jgi:hydrogenase maturation protease
VADLTRNYAHPRTIVIGLGNPMLGDDGVGWRVVDVVEALLAADERGGGGFRPVEVARIAVGGLGLMERLTGYHSAIVVDAAEFVDRPLGEVRSCPLEELGEYGAGHIDSAHDASLLTALALGRRLGTSLPDRIDTVTIRVRRMDVFTEELSPEVAAAVPNAVALVMSLLAADG